MCCLMFFADDVCEQITYTVGRDPQYQNTIVADTAPLVTAPVIVCTSKFDIKW